MIADAPPAPAAHSVRMNRSSFNSADGDITPMHATGVSGDGTPTTLSMSILAELAGAIPLIDRFQFEVFLRSMQKQIQSVGKCGFSSKRSVGPQVREKFTLEDMYFQKDPIPTSLLKLSGDLVTHSVKLFQIILKYMGIDSSDKLTPFNLEERVELVAKLYKHTLKRSETSG